MEELIDEVAGICFPVENSGRSKNTARRRWNSGFPISGSQDRRAALQDLVQRDRTRTTCRLDKAARDLSSSNSLDRCSISPRPTLLPRLRRSQDSETGVGRRCPSRIHSKNRPERCCREHRLLRPDTFVRFQMDRAGNPRGAYQAKARSAAGLDQLLFQSME